MPEHSRNELIATVALSVGLLANVITFIFFTYGHVIEEHVVETETQRLVDNLTEVFTGLIPGDVKNVLIQMLMNQKTKFLTDPNIQKMDQDVEKHNSGIKRQAFTFSLSVLAIGIAIAFYFWKREGFNLRPFLIMNALGATVVAIVELLFAKYIAGQNKPLDVNYIKYSIIDFVRKKAGPTTRTTYTDSIPVNEV